MAVNQCNCGDYLCPEHCVKPADDSLGAFLGYD